MRTHTALENQQALALETGSEIRAGLDKEDAPVIDDRLMERVLEGENLRRVFRQVKRNKGSAGIDGMSVDDLTAFVDQHGPSIHQQLLEGSYRPKPVKQVEIPKPKGGVRKLGIPTVLDRLIQQVKWPAVNGRKHNTSLQPTSGRDAAFLG
jgi:RNA-directed DNA polymerase